ncbi:hypothetical protein AYO38_10065 [bacterium SCGC AG-212-C10]|nr:hypothetical protein AYO38_10065 [bacterium SCGC AG-212-C10]
MKSFREHVTEPFAADIAAWRSNGWGEPGFLRDLKLVLGQNGARATLLYRLGHWAHVVRIPLVPTLLHQLSVALHGVELPPNVVIGPGLYMPHTVGSVIYADRIGANVTLQGGITLGLREDPRFPVIEDGVFLAAGCRVLGPITVGANSIIGANAVVVKDIPPCSTAVGVPARVVGRTKCSCYRRQCDAISDPLPPGPLSHCDGRGGVNSAPADISVLTPGL